MWRLSSRADQVGIAHGRRISSRPRPPGASRPSRQAGASVPPAVTIPRVSREREQTTRWGHRLEVEWHSRPMQIHCRFEQRFVFAFPTNRRNYDRLWTAAASETFLDGMRQSGVSAEALQPNIYSKVSDRVDRRANCTGCRTPRPQCAAFPASPARRLPVTVLNNGTVSDCGARSASAFSNASEAGCIIA